jgi:hypothetical protein
MQMADGSLVQVTQLTMPSNPYGAVPAPPMAPPQAAGPLLYARSGTPSLFPPQYDAAYDVPQGQAQPPRAPSTVPQGQAVAPQASSAPVAAAPLRDEEPLPVDTRPAVAALLHQLTKQSQQQMRRGRAGPAKGSKGAVSKRAPSAHSRDAHARRSRSATKRTSAAGPSTRRRSGSRDHGHGRAGMSTAAKKLLKARLMDRDFETVSGVTDDRSVEWGSDSGRSDEYDIGM